jgi:hypothetical protein
MDTQFEPFEPKKQNRFLVNFKNIDIPSFVVYKATRPKIVNGGWGNMSFEMWDPIAPSTTKVLYDFYNPSNSLEDLSRLLSLEMTMLDPTGYEVEKWEIQGKILEIDFGILDWYVDLPTEIKVVMSVKDCKLVG